MTHYLIRFQHFIHSTLDQRTPHAVLAACVDLSKAFNRVDHVLLVQDLFDMHAPSWLLRIIISYLTNRTMQLTFKGQCSSPRDLPAGSPQGAYLGVLIFIIKFNGAFLRPSIPRPALLQDVPSVKVKFIDDGSVPVSVDLSDLVPDHTDRQRPLSFRERAGLVLPRENNLLQFYIHDVETFASNNNMIIIKKKTQGMLFTFSRKLDFPPEIFFSNGSFLETISETTLLGVVITDDLKWKKNTSHICTKARQKLWMLRRLILLDFSVHELFDVYRKEIRSVLEYAVPVWHGGLTLRQSSEIETVQKMA